MNLLKWSISGKSTGRLSHWMRKTKFTSSFLCFHLIPKVRIFNGFFFLYAPFFTLLCFADEGKKKIGKSWSLLVYLAKTRMSFINSQEMSKYGKFLDIQVFSEVRPQRSLKFDPRPGKFKYPKYKDDDQLNGFNLKRTIETCRKKWGDIGLNEVLKNLLEFDEKNLTSEEQ